MEPMIKQMVIAFKVNGKALAANVAVTSNVTDVSPSNGFKVSPKSLFSHIVIAMHDLPLSIHFS